MSEVNQVTESNSEDIKIQQQTQNIPENDLPENLKTEENKKNWKVFREERERERLAKIESDKLAAQKAAEAEALKAALDSILNKQNSNNDDQYSNDEDDEQARIDKKVAQALEKERKRLQELKQKEESETFPQRLVQDFKDFNQVCSTENLDYLDFHYPEVTAGYQHMPDGYKKWSLVYAAVKKLVPHQNVKQDLARIEKNQMKPQASNSQMTDTQPQTSGWRLTEKQRAENWRRMQQNLKNMA